MFSDACRLIFLYLYRSIHQSFLLLYSLKATGHLSSQLPLCLVYRREEQARKVFGHFQTQADGKAENRTWKSWFLVFCFTQWKKQFLVVSILSSDYKTNTTFKMFFFKYASTPDLMSSTVLLVFLELIATSWSIKISNTTSKTRAQVLLKQQSLLRIWFCSYTAWDRNPLLTPGSTGDNFPQFRD